MRGGQSKWRFPEGSWTFGLELRGKVRTGDTNLWVSSIAEVSKGDKITQGVCVARGGGRGHTGGFPIRTSTVTAFGNFYVVILRR